MSDSRTEKFMMHEETKMKSINGYVEGITYRNEDNGYTVLTLSYGKKEIKCTGNFGYIAEGEYVEIEGEEVFHDIYGEQIKVLSYKVIPTTDELSLRKYLGSGAIKGLGAVLADRIVDKFAAVSTRLMPPLMSVFPIFLLSNAVFSLSLSCSCFLRFFIIFLRDSSGSSETTSSMKYSARICKILLFNCFST